MEFTFRQANTGDKAFLIDTIVASEKGGYDIISYCSIFSITESEFRNLLSKMLDEDIEGQEVCISNFMIAEANGKTAATIGAFIENQNGLSSNMIKMNMLIHFLGKEAIINAMPLINIMNEVNVNRRANTLQFEYGMIVEEYRGQGLLRKLMEEHVRVKRAAGVDVNVQQLMILKNNINAFKSHEKAGFKIIEEKTATNKDILKIMSCDTKILMERTV